MCTKFPPLHKHKGFILELSKDPIKASQEVGEAGTAGGKEERSVVGPPAPTGIVQKKKKPSSKHISGNMSCWHDAKRQFIKGKFSDSCSRQSNGPRGYKQANWGGKPVPALEWGQGKVGQLPREARASSRDPATGNSSHQESPIELHVDKSQRRACSLDTIQGIPSSCRVPAASSALCVS